MTAPILHNGPQAALLRFSIRFRGIVIALATVLLAYGLYALGHAKYDAFPEFAPPEVVIQTEAQGLSPEQVEILVTRPIENALNGISGLQSLRSTSTQGLSVITVLFGPGSDIYRNRQVVAERLAGVLSQLPEGVNEPSITPLTTSSALVLVAGLTSEKRSLMDLRAAVDWTIRPRLLAVSGVADIGIFGGDVRSIQIAVHPDQLIRYDLSFSDVLAAAKRASGVRGAGFIETKNQRIVFQTEGQSFWPADIARTVVRSTAAGSITLGNVADVYEAPEPAIGGATIDGKPGVVFNVSEQYGANTIEVTKAVEAALQELKDALQEEGITLHSGLLRPANFIISATRNVEVSLILGGILVIVVLFLFLFDLRIAAISCIAIPLSLLAATIVLEAMGETLNTMTLGGLAIAIGVVVDDAVIDVENIVRRLRENRRLLAPRAPARVALDAALEVRSGVAYATFAIILVVLPVMALPGVAGRLFRPLGLAYTFAVLASLLVALTVTPALSVAFLAGKKLSPTDPPLMRWLKAGYVRLLDDITQRPGLLIVATGFLTIAGCVALPLFGGSFIPELKEGHYVVHVAEVPGTSMNESLRVGTLIATALKELPFVQSVAQRIGRAELAADTWGPNYSEFEVELKPGLSGDETEAAQADIRKILGRFVGVNFTLRTFLTERVEETLSGYSAPVVIKIFGNNLDILDQKALEIARVLNDVPGAAEVQIGAPPGMPQLTIHLRKPDLERWGLDPMEVLDTIRIAYQGETAGQIYRDDQVYRIITILHRTHRDNVAEVGQLPLRTSFGSYVLLKQVADVYEAPGRYQVVHEGARRVQTITANIVGRDITSFVQAAKAAIAAKVQLPLGTYIQFAGAAEARAASQHDLILNSLLAAFGIVLLLSIVTRNWRNLLLVLTNLPFALVGGVLAIFASGGILSLGDMVGFVTLFGITLRNSILMIARYQHMVELEGMSWSFETAIRGAAERLTPILVTSIVTGLGVLPLAIGAGDPGREIEGPMAIVILGGLVTSTTLNLLVLPGLALRYGRFEAKTSEDEAQEL